MYKKEILIRFGDLMLKGKNQRDFVSSIQRLIKNKLNDLNVTIINTHNRVYLELNNEDIELVTQRLMTVSGLHSFSYVYKTSLEFEDVVKTAIHLLENELEDYDHFKINTKRANKQIPYSSLEYTQKLAPAILNHFEGKIRVDVKNPTETLNVELREKNAYLYLKTIKGLGGYPVGTGGKGLVMLSGGIDSPVAAFLALKQGVEIELLHFESSPMTPLESVDKVITISQKLAHFMPKNKIKLHLVKFANIHQEINTKIPEPYLITIMRRMMYRIGEGFAIKKGHLVLINGESIGQVASQTLESLAVVEEVTRIPIIRPLATYDKQDIINISRFINTYETSILPFEDCCTIYVPKNPATKPKIHLCELYEKNFDYNQLIQDAIDSVTTLVLDPFDEVKLSRYGFDFSDAYEEWKNDNKPSK